MTTWNERFTDAVAALCGGKHPPAQAVADWLDPMNESFALQEWALEHATLPWAQGIVVLDAAHLLAEQPQEGDGHEPRTLGVGVGHHESKAPRDADGEKHD